jgi:hypothetical protein
MGAGGLGGGRSHLCPECQGLPEAGQELRLTSLSQEWKRLRQGDPVFQGYTSRSCLKTYTYKKNYVTIPRFKKSILLGLKRNKIKASVNRFYNNMSKLKGRDVLLWSNLTLYHCIN